MVTAIIATGFSSPIWGGRLQAEPAGIDLLARRAFADHDVAGRRR